MNNEIRDKGTKALLFLQVYFTLSTLSYIFFPTKQSIVFALTYMNIVSKYVPVNGFNILINQFNPISILIVVYNVYIYFRNFLGNLQATAYTLCVTTDPILPITTDKCKASV